MRDSSEQFADSVPGSRGMLRSRFLAWTAALLVAVNGLGGGAAALETERQTRDAERVRVAMEWLPKDPTRAALVLLEVEHPAQTLYAVSAMTEVSSQPLASLILRLEDGEFLSSAFFDADGPRLLTAARDGTVKLRTPGSTVVLRGHEDRIRSARFNPEATRLPAGRGPQDQGPDDPLPDRELSDGLEAAAGAARVCYAD